MEITCRVYKPPHPVSTGAFERYRLDLAACVYVGRDASDRSFARTLGFGYCDAAELFGSAV